MPYIIILVIMIVAGGALFLFREPAEAPVAVTAEEVATEQAVDSNGIPEGFTPPTEPPPMMEVEAEAGAEMNSADTSSNESAATAANTAYVAEASYFTPRRTEHDIVVTLELAGETVVDATVTYDGGTAQTPMHMAFDNAYKSEVIGQNIDTIELSRVGGASLTSTAFNDAVAVVRAQL